MEYFFVAMRFSENGFCWAPRITPPARAITPQRETISRGHLTPVWEWFEDTWGNGHKWA